MRTVFCIAESGCVHPVNTTLMVNNQGYNTWDTCIFDKSLLWSAPNPFSGKTQIHFYLMMESDIQLNVFNNVGQMIYSIVETNKQKGAVKFEFDASDLNSGVYFYQVVVNGVPTGCQKMIIL